MENYQVNELMLPKEKNNHFSDEELFVYLTQFNGNPFKPKSAEEIYSDLSESRACYKRGEYEDFDDALDDISKKYGL